MNDSEKNLPDAAEDDPVATPPPPDAEPAAEAEAPGAAEAAGEAPQPDGEPEPAAAPDPAAEIASLNDKLLRALAEGENLRRRARRDREEASKYAIAGFAREMLAVADNLRRALDAIPDQGAEPDDARAGFVEGVRLTERELQSIMARQGIERIDPAGERFDHDWHEALFEVPTGDAPPGTVVQVIEAGYRLRDRLLRPARVGVAKAPPGPAPAAEGGEGGAGEGADGAGEGAGEGAGAGAEEGAGAGAEEAPGR